MRNLIQKLRQKGHSYHEIEKLTKTSKSTISSYCKNIKLSDLQVKKLVKNKENGLTKAKTPGSQANQNKQFCRIY